MKFKRLLAFVIALVTIIDASIFAYAAAYKGDVDDSGSVGSSDALIILQYSVGLIEKIDMKKADMDGNSKINSSDALLVLQTSIGLIDLVDLESDDPGTPVEPPVEPPVIVKTPKEIYLESFTGGVNNDTVYKNLSYLCDSIGSRYDTYSTVNTAYNYIYSTLSGYGFSGANLKSDSFYYNNTLLKNIYSIIPTSVANPDVILFCAHYDSAPDGRGAVDNASGVCTVLEIARIMKSMKKDFGKEIRFCFFAGEEVGYYGAYRYCNYVSASTSTSPASIGRHKFVLNVDMAAHPTANKNWYLCVSTEPLTSTYAYRKAVSNYTSNSVDAAKKYVGSCGEYKYYSPVTAGMHDLLPFRKNNVAGATLSWREVDSSRSGGTDYNLASPSIIHTSSDTVKNTDLNSLYKTVNLVAATAAEVTFVS